MVAIEHSPRSVRHPVYMGLGIWLAGGMPDPPHLCAEEVWEGATEGASWQGQAGAGHGAISLPAWRHLPRPFQRSPPDRAFQQKERPTLCGTFYHKETFSRALS